LQERLGPDEVQVFLLAPERSLAPELLAAYDALLSSEERERRDRLRSAAARHRFVAARALVRTTLSRFAGVEPADWAFTTTDHGRPEVHHPELAGRLRFNLSHTRGLVACGVTWERELGIDVEDAARKTRPLALARRFFAPAEVADIEAAGAERHERFLAYWTLKEAYLKARGLGLRIPLAQVAFALEAPGRPRAAFGPRVEDDPSSWQFALERPSPRHLLAVAVRRRDEPDLAVRVRDCVPLVA